MTIGMLSIDEVRPYARNARTIPDEAVNKVAASIHEFGWRQPIVVDRERVIVVGHVRLLAARQLGLKEVPVHVADNLTPAQVRAYRLLDNRSHEESFWDEDLLGLELLDLKLEGFDLDLTGFNLDEIDKFLAKADASEGLTDPDAVPAPLDQPVSRPGDLWVLGKHLLLCGDATSRTDVQRVMAGGRADLIFTDPPYGVNYKQPSVRPGRAGRGIANDNLGVGFEKFLSDACRNLIDFSGGAIYICMSSSELDTLKRVFEAAGGHWSTFVIWAKNTFTLGRSDYQRQYEPILYGWREGGEHFWCGDRDQGDVWNFNKPSVNDLHPTQKPVELIERALANSSEPGKTVLDPFCGSGSTLIACEKTGRQGRMIELDTTYVDTALTRCQDFTGQEATLENGQTFKEVAADRLGHVSRN